MCVHWWFLRFGVACQIFRQPKRNGTCLYNPNDYALLLFTLEKWKSPPTRMQKNICPFDIRVRCLCAPSIFVYVCVPSSPPLLVREMVYPGGVCFIEILLACGAIQGLPISSPPPLPAVCGERGGGCFLSPNRR